MKVESCKTGVIFCHSAFVVVLGVGEGKEFRGAGALEGVPWGSEVRVWCARWFVLRGERNCCGVLPSIRMVDPLLKGSGVEVVPYSEGWCEVTEVARDFKRGLRSGVGSARLDGGRGTPSSLCRMFIRIKGAYGVLVLVCWASDFIVGSVAGVGGIECESYCILNGRAWGFRAGVFLCLD